MRNAHFYKLSLINNNAINLLERTSESFELLEDLQNLFQDAFVILWYTVSYSKSTLMEIENYF